MGAASEWIPWVQHADYASLGGGFQLLEVCFDSDGRLVHFDYSDAADLAVRRKVRRTEFDLPAIWLRLVVGESTGEDVVALLGTQYARRRTPGQHRRERWTFCSATRRPRSDVPPLAAVRSGRRFDAIAQQLTVEIDASGILVAKWGWSSLP
jgi:hypothetical protein